MPGVWQWQDDYDNWVPYAKKDGAKMEEAYRAGKTVLRTTDLSFNVGFGTLYHYNFKNMTQLNTYSRHRRDIRRVKGIEEMSIEEVCEFNYKQVKKGQPALPGGPVPPPGSPPAAKKRKVDEEKKEEKAKKTKVETKIEDTAEGKKCIVEAPFDTESIELDVTLAKEEKEGKAVEVEFEVKVKGKMIKGTEVEIEPEEEAKKTKAEVKTEDTAEGKKVVVVAPFDTRSIELEVTFAKEEEKGKAVEVEFEVKVKGKKIKGTEVAIDPKKEEE